MARGLEALPPDVLVLILTALSSYDDLYALIRASPTLYHVFSQVKASVLLGISAHQLGPATRDAMVLVQNELHPFSARPLETYCARADEAVANWRRHLTGAGRKQWLEGSVSVEAAVQLVRVNRTIQFFVDTYARVRFADFEEGDPSGRQPRTTPIATTTTESNDTDVVENGTWAPSSTERAHLSQAFIRRQIILDMTRVADVDPPSTKLYWAHLLLRIQALFEPWELEQVSQADSFVCSLCAASRNLDRVSKDVVPPENLRDAIEWWRGLHWARQDAIPGGRGPGLPRDVLGRRWDVDQGQSWIEMLDEDDKDAMEPWTPDGRLLGRYIDASYPQLATLRHRLTHAEEPGRLGRLLRYNKLTRSGLTSFSTPYDYQSTPSFVYVFLHASDQYLYRYEPARIFPSLEPELVPCNLAVSEEDGLSSLSPPPLDPPWAWMDAMAGRRDRGDPWGWGLHPTMPGRAQRELWISHRMDIVTWKWAGAVFWDRDRAQRLQTRGLLGEDTGTGWLVAPPWLR